MERRLSLGASYQPLRCRSLLETSQRFAQRLARRLARGSVCGHVLECVKKIALVCQPPKRPGTRESPGQPWSVDESPEPQLRYHDHLLLYS